MTSATLFLLLVALTSVLGAPNPIAQEDNDSEVEGRTIYSTDTCNEAEFQAMQDDFSKCSDKSTDLISEALLFGEAFDDNNVYRKVVCKGWSGVIDCVDSIVSTCFNEEDTEIRERRFLVDYFKKAHNDTDLGRNFISSCPTLNTGRTELMFDLAGSDKCTFVEYDTIGDLFGECLDEAVALRTKQRKRLAVVSGTEKKVALLSRIECIANTKIMNECVALVQGCLGGQKNIDFVKKWSGILEERNKGIQSDLPTFDYESCAGLSLRSDLEA